jgi:hypothetical protein
LRACRHPAPGERRDNDEPDKSSPPAHQLPAKCRPYDRHEVVISISLPSPPVVIPDHGQLISRTPSREVAAVK